MKLKNEANGIPPSRRPRPRPLPVMTTISVSSWGISVTFWRKTFSISLAIKTMSSPGCRGRQTLLAKHTTSMLGICGMKSVHGQNSSTALPHYLVVYVAVGKHGVEVLNTFLGILVVTVLKPFLDCSHVHRTFDYGVIVLKALKHKCLFNM